MNEHLNTAVPGPPRRVLPNLPQGGIAIRNGSAPQGLILTADAAQLQASVCGVPVIRRMVCAMNRAAAGVHVIQTATVIDADFDELRAATASAPVARVRWSANPAGISGACGLLLAWRPVVFDPRICAALERVADRHEKIIRFLRAGEDHAPLWFVGAVHADALLQRLATTPTPSAAAEFLADSAVYDIDPGVSVCDVVPDGAARQRTEVRLLAQCRKESDTWIARNVDRHISLWLTKRLMRYAITPNQVTLAATVLGLIGAALLAVGGHAWSIAGSGMLVVSIILDGCDGEIARLKMMESEFGRKFDFFLDNVVNVLALFAVGCGLYRQSGTALYLYAGLASAGAALASVFPVYWLFFRTAKSAVQPAATPARKRDAFALTEAIAGRDFVYTLFVFAVADQLQWFALAAVAGLGVFLTLVLTLVALRVARGTVSSSRRSTFGGNR